MLCNVLRYADLSISVMYDLCRSTTVTKMRRRKTLYRLLSWIILGLIFWLFWINEFKTANHGRMSAVSMELPEKHIFSTARNITAFQIRHSINNIPHVKVGSDNFSHSGIAKVQGLTFRNKIFYLNHQPIRIFSGAIHYFRVVPEYWKDRLMKLKSCGLNTVETYVPWNLHESSPGFFNFKGILDLKHFITLAAQLGLWVILRPGPFICAEFEFGGLPAWLMDDPKMKVRTNYPGYVSAVSKYFSVLLPLVDSLQFTKGGPIIMYQIENEYSAYGKDIEHLRLLLYFMKHFGVKELLATSDHKFRDKYVVDKTFDFSKYVLLTDNFASKWRNSFDVITSLNKHFPMMVMEFWTGWFDHWGQKTHSTTSVSVVNDTLNFVFDINGSFNLYMFIGGTNFGFTAGANNFSSHLPIVTSYDYDAVLSEAGDITPKYTLIRNRLLEYYKSKGIKELPAVPPNTTKGDYGSLQVSEMMEWDDFLSHLPVVATSKTPNFMETYRDHHGHYSTTGYIVYSYNSMDNTTMNKLFGAKLEGVMNDRLTAILNSEIFFNKDYLSPQDSTFPMYRWDVNMKAGKHVQTESSAFKVEHRNDYDYFLTEPTWHYQFIHSFKEMALKLIKKGTELAYQLDLLVENLGRINYSERSKPLLDYQRKGFHGKVFSHVLSGARDWNIRFINFNSEQCNILSKSTSWLPVIESKKNLKDKLEKRSPRLYRAYLNITGAPNDTFVKLDGWTKGVVIVNKFNLGRYWHIGPQRTLYLPAPILKTGNNEIMIFEEVKWGKTVSFQDYSVLQ